MWRAEGKWLPKTSRKVRAGAQGSGRRGGRRDPAPPDIPGIGGAGRERGGAAAAGAPAREGAAGGGRSAAGS